MENVRVKRVVQDWLRPSRVRWPDAEAGPWAVTLTWRQGDAGAVVCTGVSVELLPDQPAQAVTATLMRELPVGRLVASARAERFAEQGGDVAAAVDAGQELDVGPGLVDSLRAQAEPWAERTPGRPVELDVKLYREVAGIYSAALTAGKPPLLAVQNKWTISRPTASRWVKAARDAALLPETDRGRARGNGPITTNNKAKGTPR